MSINALQKTQARSATPATEEESAFNQKVASIKERIKKHPSQLGQQKINYLSGLMN